MPATATSDAAAWRVIESALAATGWCKRVQIGEPQSPPEPITACILGDSGEIPATDLGAPHELHRVILRFYAPFLEEPEEQVELDLEQIRANIWADINADFELGGNIAFIWPTGCSWRWGNLEIGHQMYRILDMTIAYYVHDRAPFTA